MAALGAGAGERPLVERARKTPLARPAIEALARELPEEPLDVDVRAALASGSIHAAEALALAAAVAGRRLERDTVALLLPELDSAAFLPAIAQTCDGDVPALLVEVVQNSSLMLESTLVALALATRLCAGASPPPGLVPALRSLARRDLWDDERVLVVEAARALGDGWLSALAERERLPDDVEALPDARFLDDPLACLPDKPPPVAVSGYTYRHLEAPPGRNDPCPCGSGKKFKKCHGAGGLSEPTPVTSATGFSASLLLPGAARRLPRDQFQQLRPSELAQFDPSELSEVQLGMAYNKLVASRRWDEAERLLPEMARRDALPGGSTPKEYLRDLVVNVIRAGELARAERLLASAPPELARGEIELLLALARQRPEAFALIEAAASEGLAGNVERIYDVAYALLDHSPALGVLVARGSLEAGHNFDSETLLFEAEAARDRLSVSPEEPYWELLDAIWDGGAQASAALARRRRAGAPEVDSDEVAKLREQMAEARVRARELEEELNGRERVMQELQERHRELETLVANTGVADHARRVDELESERRRLRARIEELKGTLREGAEQRRDLRERLADHGRARPEARAPEAPAAPEPVDDVEEVAAPVTERKRPVRVPLFADEARRQLEALPADVAAAALTCTAGLSAGSEHVWQGVKRLQRTSDAFSARVGIHHRVLFRPRSDAIEVLDVVHRRDLERAIDRLM